MKASHGGKRTGAGRPLVAGTKKRGVVTVRLPQWLIDQIPVEDRGVFIERALCRGMNIKAPENL